MILFVTRRFSGLSKDIVHLTNTNAAVSTVNVQYVCLCVCVSACAQVGRVVTMDLLTGSLLTAVHVVNVEYVYLRVCLSVAVFA